MRKVSVVSLLLCMLSFVTCGFSAEDSAGSSDLKWLVKKTHLTTEIVLPSLSFSGKRSDDDVQRATFFEIRVTERGGTCKALLERGKVKFNDFGDGEFLQPPAVETQVVSLHTIAGIDRRGGGRKLFAVEFPEKKFVNRVYLLLSPGPVKPDCLLIVDAQLNPAPVDSIPEEPKLGDRPFLFKHIVPLRSLDEPNLLAAVSRPGLLSGMSENVEVPGIERRSTVSINHRVGESGSLLIDQNLVSRDPVGNIQFSTMIGFVPQPVILKKRDLKDPTGKNRTIIDLHADQTRSTPFGVGGAATPRQVSLVLNPMNSGTDRLLITTDGQLTNIEEFQDTQRNKLLMARKDIANSVMDLEVLNRSYELVGSGIDFNIENGSIVGATIYENGVVPSLLNSFSSLSSLRNLGFSYCRKNSFSSDVKFLRQLRNLEHLSFYCSPVNDAVLEEIGQLPHLTGIRIYDELPDGMRANTAPHVTDAGLKHLRGHQKITDISLYGPGISDDGIMVLASLPKLSKLELQDTVLTMRGLVSFKKARPDVNLRMQTLELDDDSAGSMSVQLNGKKAAVIEGELAGDAEIHELVRLTDLRHVRISQQNRITERGFSELSSLPDLEVLLLSNLRQLSNQGVSEIAKLKKLKELSLWCCESIDDQAVPDLGKLTSLSKLQITGTKISPDGRSQLQKLLPKCVFEK